MCKDGVCLGGKILRLGERRLAENLLSYAYDLVFYSALNIIGKFIT